MLYARDHSRGGIGLANWLGVRTMYYAGINVCCKYDVGISGCSSKVEGCIELHDYSVMPPKMHLIKDGIDITSRIKEPLIKSIHNDNFFWVNRDAWAYRGRETGWHFIYKDKDLTAGLARKVECVTLNNNRWVGRRKNQEVLIEIKMEKDICYIV